jgi:small-conductance mechanosensitive channel
VDAIREYLQAWLESAGQDGLAVLETIGAIVIYMGAGWLIGRLVSDRVVRLLSVRSFGRNGALMLGRIISVTFVLIAFLLLLGRLGANWTGLLTFVSASAIAISLSIQDVLRNFVCGIYLLLERPFRVGDRIKVRDVIGEVQGVDIRTTLIRNEDSELVLVPNAIVFTEILSNRSHYRVRRLEFSIMKLRRPIHEVEKALADALDNLEGVRRPIPAPTITGSGEDGRSMTQRLLVDRNPSVELEVIERVIGALGDAEVTVSRS